MKIRLGTRGSRLALVQAENAKAMILAAFPGAEVEIVTIATSGDRGDRDRLGAFVREIQEALLDGRVDVALHCLKDLPTAQVPGLAFAAYPEREDASDLLITRGPDLSDLPAKSLIGTGSVRRTGQLAVQRDDLTYAPLVGNVDTRLGKLMKGEFDAIVLAHAGLKRLGLMDRWSTSEYQSLTLHQLPFQVMLPAPGQAILVLETREGEQGLVNLFDHLPTRQCALAERAFLRAFGGGCSVPVAAYATSNSELCLTGRVVSRNGRSSFEGSQNGRPEDAESLGDRLARELGEAGAFDLVKSELGMVGR